MSVLAETQPKTPRSRFSKALSRWVTGLPLRLVIIIIAFIWTLPTIGLLISSFRTPADIQSSGWWTALLHPFQAAQWTIQNYATVFTEGDMGTAFLNSFLVTVPSVVIPITIAAFAAYAFAWLQFPGRSFLFALVIGLMVVPLQMSLIPMLRVYTMLDLNGTFLGVWLAHTGFGLPLAVYLLHGYISSLPKEIIESAQIDGASPMTTFTSLVLPLSVPAIASFAIFQFLWVWNDLLVALVFLGTSRDTAVVTANLARLIGDRGQDWHILTAGAFVTMIVPLIIFFSLQRYFVRGLTAGSVKG
ncbi:MAG: carbohydrate ABC transporter permease [Chloroflexi bacterium]|nr:carbohydrate ABC transporter permease [Chloroflexota bacterium]